MQSQFKVCLRAGGFALYFAIACSGSEANKSNDVSSEAGAGASTGGGATVPNGGGGSAAVGIVGGTGNGSGASSGVLVSGGVGNNTGGTVGSSGSGNQTNVGGASSGTETSSGGTAVPTGGVGGTAKATGGSSAKATGGSSAKATGGSTAQTSGGVSATSSGGTGTSSASGGVSNTGGTSMSGNSAGTGGTATANSGTIYLSDLCFSASTNAWGPVERDLSNGEQEERDGGPIIINGVAFSRGLGMHAPSEASFNLGGHCSSFHAEVGIDEEMKGAGSVIFQVFGDGDLLYESSSTHGWQGPTPIDVDIGGSNELRLVVSDDGGNGSDHADWGDARVVCENLVADSCTPVEPAIPVPSGMQLAWSDEFDVEGRPSSDNWDYESGMVRNNEWQYYTDQNATVVGGFLIIQGRRESYQGADYTSSSLRSVRYSPWKELHTFKYGRFEMRARVVAEPGMWPAFWTLGTGLGNWPFNGEIDIMEYYNNRVHANVACSASSDQNAYSAKWVGAERLVSDFGVQDWDAKFHVWRMDWDSQRIVLSVDDYVMNDVTISQMHNPDGSNPFAQTHYILVNLAIGGDGGGDASGTHFPVHYVVDYVRVYQ